MRFVKLILVIAFFPVFLGNAQAAEPVFLENSRLALSIGSDDGAVQSVYDKKLDVSYDFKGIGFEFSTMEGITKGLIAKSVKQNPGNVILNFESNGHTIALYYTLGINDGFIEKWIEIKAKGNKPYFIKGVNLEDASLGKQFKEIHFHDDNTIWHCPINLFLRGEKGGCFAGLQYPYWDMDIKKHSGFKLGFSPNYQVAAGETFVSEKYFLGVFRKEGIHRVSQGPYPGRGRYPLISKFGGLSQHFKGGIPNPIKDVPVEVLDWGEVWAMKEFMRHVLPNDLTLPEEGYWVWQNGWWAGLWNPENSMLDYLKQAGIHDVMTAHTWYGRGMHPLTPPYIGKMRTAPMGFPKDTAIAGMPNSKNVIQGVDHADQSEAQILLDNFKENEYTPEFILPKAMEKFHKYGKEIGVHVNSFSIASLYFEDHPEWACIDENGKVCEYLFKRKASCFASDEYAEHMFNITDHVFKKFQPRYWGWDGRWLSFWEVGHYRPGPKGAGPDPCYAKNHGHLPGDNRYKEWKNIMAFLKKLKERYPKVCLESYYGLHRGGPWALRHFNSAYHYFETHDADLNRMQAWHQQNDRFRPVYKNSLDLFGKDPKSFRFNVIAGLSISNYCMIGQAYPQFKAKENRDFFKKWRAWASENLDYLTVKRDLFDSPGNSPLDGSAHIIKDRGFIFLFRGGFDAGRNQNTALRASIPINRWLKLEENPKAIYQIKEIYPNADKVHATVRYGDNFLFDMPKDPAVVFEIKPAPSGSRIFQSVTEDAEKGRQVLSAFTVAVPKPTAPKPITELVPSSLSLNAKQPKYQTDKNGMLAPQMSYARFLARTFNFVFEELDEGWASGNTFKDQDGKLVPPYINYALANRQRKLGVGHPRNANTVYPAFHHALYIRAFLSHWRHTGDSRCLSRACQLADWNLARRTPSKYSFGSLFYSTAYKGKVGGSVDGDAIMTDKPAIMALALLELYDVTGYARYLDAAEAVAATLAKTQLPDGNWPFRVIPETGEVQEEYTSSVIYAVMLFESLDQRTKGNRWHKAKAKALRWILEGPVKTMRWTGFYEDITKNMGKSNLTNWDCIDTARWLISHRSDNPEYLTIAHRLHDWIVKEFVDKNKAWAPAEGLREQKVCFATMGIHTLHWAALLADFYEATGDKSFRERAVNACSLVTYWMRDDNANCVGPTWGREIWFSCHFGPAVFMYDTLSRFPELLVDE